MADAADEAEAIQAVQIAASIAYHRKQLAQPSTGLCAVCGDPIAPARLAALASARACIKCASKRTTP